MDRIYGAGHKTDNEVMTIFKGIVNSNKFQENVEQLLYDAAIQGKTQVKLRLNFSQTSNRSHSGYMTITLQSTVLFDQEFGTEFVKSACNNDFMKFGNVLKELFDESRMLYDVNEVANFTESSSRTGNSPTIEFMIKLINGEN